MERRAIAGFHGYEIDRAGVVYSRRGKPMKTRLMWSGRPYVGLRDAAGKCCNRYISTLLLEAFVSPRPEGKECAHLDGNRLNNDLRNLAWVSRRENHAHKIVHGTFQHGERHGMHKLTFDAVKEIRQAEPFDSAALAKKYGVCRETIKRVRYFRAWNGEPSADRKAEVARAIRQLATLERTDRGSS